VNRRETFKGAWPVQAGPGPNRPPHATLNVDEPGVLETPAAVAIQSGRTAVEMNTPMAVIMYKDGIAEALESLITKADHSIDVAVYRFNNPKLAGAIAGALERGIRIRLVLDQNKYEESAAARELFSAGTIPFRLRYGRNGPGSKMHHKFAIIDGEVLVTGSYNWTIESEDQNYENLLILRDPEQVGIYQREFETLWAESTCAP
jgi:phosphatidylserine/phosphatidylglycerophosphate/cardiolipin synthase-like enzyme